MSDPNAKTEPSPPPQPPRRPVEPTSTTQSQLVADEQYARQLAEHYNGAASYGAPRRGSRGRQDYAFQTPKRTQTSPYGGDDEKERSFIDGELVFYFTYDRQTKTGGR